MYDDDIIGLLCNIYVIAEEMIDPAVKNLALKDLHRVSCSSDLVTLRFYYPGVTPIKTIYNGTASADSPARRFLVYQYLLTWDKKDFRENKDLYPAEFIAEILGEITENGIPPACRPPFTFVDMDNYMEEIEDEDE